MTDYKIAQTSANTIPGDPIQVQIHTLSNGLRLFMSVNREAPRIYTEIAVRAGSKHDPPETTGLAHYFEHMMFKGTDRLGTLDWEKEKPFLDQINALFEAHRKEQDPERKKILYAEIDRVSGEAATFAAANEYDKLVSAIGAKDTNAYTWVEQTVYVNDIPSNELERWFSLESERFRRPILRLFHTELETVFEEYNISQDRDFRKTLKAMQESLTPSHPYGTQTTLGRGEDLKNPSQQNIYEFFDRYYVPNNIGIVLCGDFDPDTAIALAEQFFGHYQSKTLPPFTYPEQPEIPGRVQRDVYGNEAPWVEIGWRFPGANSDEARMLPLISGILYNNQAGLFDLNLVQQQAVLETYAYPRIYEDFSSLVLHAKPREGQTLEQVEQLLIGEIEKLREGKFEDWLPEAVIKDMKLSEIKEFEKNQGRAAAITGAFILGLPWESVVSRWAWMEKLTKADVVEFARKFIPSDKYVAVYKHIGADPGVMKVDKPPITPVVLNRTNNSEFADAFLSKNTPDIEPQFADFKKSIQRTRIVPGVRAHVVKDPESRLFRLHYIFEMGTTSDPRLAMATSYLPYLGTSRYTAAEIQQAFYRIGVNFSANCQEDHLYLSLSGLEESFEEGVKLMDHLIADARPNPEAFQNLIADILVRRENNKRDKRTILSKAMLQFAKYGRVNPYTNKIPKEKLLAMAPEALTDIIRSLKNYKHEIFYTGVRSVRTIGQMLRTQRTFEGALQATIPAKKFREKAVPDNQVYFVHFPMVQVELLLLSRGTPHFNLEEFIFSEWYNQYFGYGLSSIVFQDIRESKALAYAAYAFAGNPARQRRSHFLQAYVGTQPDKLRDAVEAFQTILEDMPVSLTQMENARQSVMKQIAAGRILKSDLFWTWRQNQKRGFSRDLRKDIYDTMGNAGPDDLIRYQKQYLRGRNFNWMVLGEREAVDFDFLRSIGKVKEISLETLFGY